MSDFFTARFAKDPASFQALQEGLKKNGYVTEDDEPFMNRPIYNSLTDERYQETFKMYYRGQSTEMTVKCAVFDVGQGFPSFYVAYDTTRFEDSCHLSIELKRIGVLK